MSSSTPPLSDDDVLRRPIIILGSPRSGTTLLGATFQRHPDLTYIEEPRLTWKIGNEGKSDVLQPKDAPAATCAAIRARFARMVREGPGSRLLEKHPSNSLRPAFVNEVFPDAIFVHIYRDPVETILSIRDLWLRQGHGFRSVKKSNYLRRLRELTLRQAPGMAWVSWSGKIGQVATKS